MKEIKEILEKAKTANYSPEQIVKEIEPVNKSFSLLISKYLTKDNILFIIGVITFFILLKQEFFDNEDDSKSFNEYLQNENKRIRAELKDLEKEALKKDSVILARTPALNKPCPCGSGKKFKRCHGLRK